MLTPVFLAVPAHNEERALPRLLDSVYASALPEGMAWSEWVILDDASTDGTVEVAGAWGRAHPEVPLRVDRAPARLGMGGNLERFRRYVTAQCPDAVVVVVDADVVVEQGSLYRLLEPFQKIAASPSPSASTVWRGATGGDGRPPSSSRWRRP